MDSGPARVAGTRPREVVGGRPPNAPVPRGEGIDSEV
jgi:hypothetical protein